MATSSRPPTNGFVRSLRKVYNPIGFTKGYNFILWFIFGGALLGFALARSPYLDFHGVFCSRDAGASMGAAPGECWYYLHGARHETVGIILHLAGVIPGSILAFFQFIPVIRHKFILAHRVNGYLVLLLALFSTVGALLITRHAFGGGLDSQIISGLLGIAFIVSMVLAYINIKRLQIEEHRAWMLRGWFYAGSIITARFIMFIAATVMSQQTGYYAPRPCEQLDFIFKGNRTATLAQFPDCAAFYSGESLGQNALVEANMDGGSAANAAAALGLGFGPAIWLSFVIHAVGIEIYLKLTPAEHERLRKVSYQRQLEAGMKNPGRAGLTADRLGDAEPWLPVTEQDGGCGVGPGEKPASSI